MITADDWYAWKSHPVTQAVFQAIAQKIYNTQITLGYTAGADPLTDRWLVGQIFAYEDILKAEPEEVITDANLEDAGA